MPIEEIKKVILSVINDKDILSNISEEQDFFEQGASSLTVIDMQLQIEEKLGHNVETASLMSEPTIKGWVCAYENAISS